MVTARRLKLDNGSFVPDKEYIDYSNPAASAFFAKVLVNVTTCVM
jgi:hypothetical protein